MTAVALTRSFRSPPTTAIGLVLRAAPGALAAMLTPVIASAASSTCPPPVLPESPLTPALLVGAGIAAAGLLAWLRRRRGLPSAVVSVIAVVILAGALFGSVAAGADSTACPPPSGSGVQPASTSSTPGTGAEVPWIDALVLIGGGALITVIAYPRRRRSRG